ncbi:hypothetical protein MJO28_004711 [Puccinia striiformis f. sp. tritici]|uniref:Peptidyl-tRNA hydrolase n=2 Tax=Puccinia striiformis TaxID=27350 RepID=A0A2S4UZ48_9BASI|nr:hypothetical protein MJO28_004711 [Puccinia striiformis f. sp. tritici]KAI7959741.1 hypothetical protein MJO29_004809 [Puccinia striiformis f. sp. tritici]POW02552.1 hypothetical protein PSHT_12057 [Puccinia striiformis]
MSQSTKALIVGLGNYTHPLTRHSVRFHSLLPEVLELKYLCLFVKISQVALDNIHNLLNHHHRFKPVYNAKEPTASGLRSIQSSSEISNHLKLSKPCSAWIARHDFELDQDSSGPTTTRRVSFHLLKPRAAMNISGPVVQSYHSQLSRTNDSDRPTKLIMIHDELDLKPLTVRLKEPPRSSKHKGHNGLRSVFASLKSYSPQDLYTIGIGIGRDTRNPTSKDSGDVGRWVLGPLSRNEIEACSWDVDHSPSTYNPQRQQGSVVLEVWKHILEIIKN